MKKTIVAVTLAILALGLAACSGADKPAEQKTEAVTLSYANFPPKITFPCVQMERWAKEVNARTDGAVTVNTFPGSTLLGAKNMLRGVQEGQADIGCLSLAYYPGVFPCTIATNLPVGFSSATVASLTLWDLFQKYKPAEFKNLKVLTMFTSAPSNVMSKEPLKSLDDMRGVELRGSGSLLRMIEIMGAQPVGMPMSQTPEALQKGVVKGLVSSLEVLKDFNFAEICRHETITNLPVYPFAVVMNLDKWNSLPESTQKVLEDLGREQALWTGQYMDKHIHEAIEWSKEKYGINIYELTEAEQAKIRSKGQGIIADWKTEAAKAGYDANTVLGDVMKLKAKYEAEYPAQ
jgi:TRAP-type C4-dicarboxylate transport system substrate-binding protein